MTKEYDKIIAKTVKLFNKLLFKIEENKKTWSESQKLQAQSIQKEIDESWYSNPNIR